MKQTIGGVSKKFKRMAEVYKIFGVGWTDYHEFTDEKLIELFNHESFGTPVSDNNGYALGKKWLNVNVSMWFEDIEKGYFFKSELYQDEKYPHWWLDNLFKKL